MVTMEKKMKPFAIAWHSNRAENWMNQTP
jgi:hypothetical protein